jgi:hypothetical protein
VHPTTVWSWVRKVSTEAGLDAVPTHTLRHTALAIGNDATGDLRAVQDFARHAEVDTTAGYTRSTAERLGKVADAIASFYDPGAGDVAAPEPLLPTLPFRELVAMVEGAHAVGAWAQLAGPLARRGWRLAGTLAGTATLSLAFSPLLHAAVTKPGPGRPATFHLQRFESADPDADYEEWTFDDAEDLLAVAALFERGLPTPEPDAGTTAGRYWVTQ